MDKENISDVTLCFLSGGFGLITPHWLGVLMALHMVCLAAIQLSITVLPQRFLAFDFKKLWTKLKVLSLGVFVEDFLDSLFKNNGATCCNPKTPKTHF